MPGSKHTAGDSLEAIDQFGDRNLGMIVNEQMHMIVFSVEFYKGRFKILTYFGEDVPHVLKNWFGEDFAPIFCHKDQVNMHIEYAVSSMSNFA